MPVREYSPSQKTLRMVSCENRFATLIALLLVPCLYLVVEDLRYLCQRSQKQSLTDNNQTYCSEVEKGIS